MSGGKYKVHYFQAPGRAEVTRLCLTLGNVPYEDVYYTRDSLAEFKPKTPFGQLPVLETPEGKLLAQSGAIDRFAAKLAGLYPQDPWEAALADQAVFQMTDIFELFIATFSMGPEERIKARQELLAGKAKDKMNALSKILEPVESSGKYIAGDKLSYGDLAIFVSLSGLKSGQMDGIPATVLDEYPVLKSYRNRIANVPGIKAFYEKNTDGSRPAYKADA